MCFLLGTHICFPNHRVPWRSLKNHWSCYLWSIVVFPSNLDLPVVLLVFLPLSFVWLPLQLWYHSPLLDWDTQSPVTTLVAFFWQKWCCITPFGLRRQLRHWHAWMVIDSMVIILNQFYPSLLPQIQIHLSEDVLKALVIIVYLTLMTNEIVPPYLKSIHNCG
jgi:hypothetical protein